MRAVFGLVLVLGMGLAGFAVYMVKEYMSDQEQALAAERARAQDVVDTVDVYAVSRAIAYGEVITAEDVEVIKYAAAYLPEGTFKTKEELFPQGTDVARVAIRSFEAREPILSAKVTAPGQLAGITQRLAPGMRAFTINVDASTGVSGFLRPGDRVDVYWTGSVSGGQYGSGREITRLIDSAVELIAVDQSADGERSAVSVANTVTVQVSPEDVAGLAQAQSTGSLSLSLVGAGDETVVSAIEVDQATLLGIEEIVEEAAPVLQALPEVCTIRNRKGAEIVETQIPCTN